MSKRKRIFFSYFIFFLFTFQLGLLCTGFLYGEQTKMKQFTELSDDQNDEESSIDDDLKTDTEIFEDLTEDDLKFFSAARTIHYFNKGLFYTQNDISNYIVYTNTPYSPPEMS